MLDQIKKRYGRVYLFILHQSPYERLVRYRRTATVLLKMLYGLHFISAPTEVFLLS